MKFIKHFVTRAIALAIPIFIANSAFAQESKLLLAFQPKTTNVEDVGATPQHRGNAVPRFYQLHSYSEAGVIARSGKLIAQALPGQVLKKLGLTEAQKQQIKAIQEREQDSRRSITQQLRSNEEELRSLMEGTASNDAIRQKFSQVQSLRQQSIKMHFEQVLAIREVLTPQQRSQLSQSVKRGIGRLQEKVPRRQSSEVQ